MSKTTTVRARIEPALKAEVESILGQIGLTSSEAIQMLYRQIKLRGSLPFGLEIPNALTAKVLADSAAGKNLHSFETLEEMFADLEK